MKKFSLFVACCLLIMGCVSAWFYQHFQSYIKTPLALQSETTFEVERGTSFNKLLQQLVSQNIITEPLLFKLHAKHQKKTSKIKAGEYLIKPNLTPAELLTLLCSGRSVSYSFTIVEGSTFKQLQQSLIEQKNLIDDVSTLSNEALLKAIRSEFTHPEGIFLAETYSYHKGDSALALLKRAHNLLQEKLKQNWQSRSKELPYKKPYQALIMASIVEKETARSDERPLIAGVFVSRLNKGMRLQTDPTVIYGMGDSYKGNIRRSDLRRKTPYNTYVIKGLPPTPIAMVGPEAIAAALNPKQSNKLYFVAKGDGSHYFSATLREHNNAVKRYQLKRRKDYRSSP